MLHIKKFFSLTHQIRDEEIIIEGPLPASKLWELQFHEELSSFRPSAEQQAAIIEIAELPEGRIIVARKEELVIGYVTFLFPDPLERWYEAKSNWIVELGAIEVIPHYRSLSVAKNLLKVAFMDSFMEKYIVFTTEYYWHWDLKGTGLNVWEYRKAMEKMMNSAGLVWMATDDPEICSHPANCLMVRIGSEVDQDTIELFDRTRIQSRIMY